MNEIDLKSYFIEVKEKNNVLRAQDSFQKCIEFCKRIDPDTYHRIIKEAGQDYFTLFYEVFCNIERK